MRILDITSRLPYPLIDGARIVMYQLIQGLASQGHCVHLVAVDEEMTDPGPLNDIATVDVLALHPLPRNLGALVTLFDRRPYTQMKRERDEVYQHLDRLYRENPFDAVIADQAHVAPYGAYLKERYGIPYLLRCHNIEHEIWRRHLVTERNPLLRSYIKLQTKRWERFEQEQMKLADCCVAITDRDRDAINRLAPGIAAHTIPAAVDINAFPYVDPDEREENSMILLGNMIWPPNRNAVLWFVGEVLPLIMRDRPDAVCYLVGDNPPTAQLPAASANFRIEGRVESILPYYRRIAIGLIPLNVGGGMRVKLVEMMSSGMPIVSTRQGAEGNSAIPGVHYFQGDSPEEFARAVVQLMSDRGEQKRLARCARQFVSERYSLEQTSRQLESILLDLVDSQKTATVSR